MPALDLVVRCVPSTSIRARQVSAMFDVPPSAEDILEWRGNLPLDERAWNVGLIVGPSGAGKSTIAKHLFGDDLMSAFEWTGASVLDDFDASLSLETITNVCSAVGFNTIPAWLRPFHVLSNGEQFRVSMARALLSMQERLVVDEFTSVVDRQTAQIGSHAIQKFVRNNNTQFVAVSCHYDIMEWLRPDWVLEPATMNFQWRALQPRPPITVRIARVPYNTWRLFARYHYLSADLNKAAQCYAAFIGDKPVAFAGVLHRPHPQAQNIWGISRLVTLPDYQGLGLAFVLADTLGGAFRSVGKWLHTYPAHPALIRAFDRSAVWAMRKKPGVFAPASRMTGTVEGFGGRPCAVFRYVGPAMDDKQHAYRLLNIRSLNHNSDTTTKADHAKPTELSPASV